MRVAVIGGGMAGLAAAHALLRRGADPVVFEAAARAGGKVGSRSERGWLTEDGPHFLARPLDTLLDVAGLGGEVLEPAGSRARFVHLRGRVLRAPSLRFLAAAGAPRALLEPLFTGPLREGATLRDLLVARFGRRAGSLAAELMAAGVYAGDPDALSGRDAFPGLADGSILLRALRAGRNRLWSLRRGLGSLPEMLAAKLGARVRLGAPVAALAPAQGGWDVQSERFESVVLAVPAARAAELASEFALPLASELRQLRTAPVALVHLGFPHDGLPRGFGVLDADGTLHAIGTLFPSSMLPGRAPEGRALLSAVCGGARHPEHASLPDEQLVAAVCADLRRTLGVKRDPEYVRVVRHPEAIPQYAPGHRERVRAARELLPPGLALAGAAYDGVSVPDVARSGEAAAERLLAR
jgi:oxygen-dependent protoporphyrinogen oxidase